MAKKLTKTSVQLPPEMLKNLVWPGLSKSEVIRLAIERAQYFATANSENIANLANEYAPILGLALADLGREDYRIAARALPEIVEGFLRENPGTVWCYEGGDRHQLDSEALIDQLRTLDAPGRIGVLDCTVAARHRTPATEDVFAPRTNAPANTRMEPTRR